MPLVRRWLLLASAGLLLAGCTPVASSPVGRGRDRVCEWVRDSVRSGAMSLDLAYGWYAECAPFEVPR